MKINEFIEQYNERFPNKEFFNMFDERFPPAERFYGATEQMIASFEGELGFRLPSSYKEFLMEFSNGILLLAWEPIGGISENSPCGMIGPVNKIIPNIPEKVLIEETNEVIDSNQLISLTTFDAGEVSNNHWVFICEKDSVDYNYRLGFIGQSSLSIVKIIKNFEEWLEIFWKGNKNAEIAVPTFHILYPDYDERQKILYEFLR
ncbi:SMI1/KNR4 family protein [Paenisporosarcina sp. NPDC076898]|uniref:SMI1/KNR4 family protein n=1 Tax=unclassified Paenisporosarcina TaxID=2642018 RepID=UPI003D0285F1